MNKSLKFQPKIIDSILGQEKFRTPRLFDDKNLTIGDTLDLVNAETKQTFGTAKVIDIVETTFGEMIKEDVADVDEVYKEFESYYNRKIDHKDKLIWVDLELIK